MSQTVTCPACGKTIAVKGIPKHTNGCPEWASKFPDTPPSRFDFDRHYKRKLWAEGLVEGEDYVRCLLCVPVEVRALRLTDHLKHVHGVGKAEYLSRFPEAQMVAQRVVKARVSTVMERYGTDNVAKSDEIRVKLRENNRSQEPAAKAKRAATNRGRYGHENPFGSGEVQARIRETMVERYGAENPQQVPEIKARTDATIRAKHGGKHFFQTEDFKEKAKATSRERFGADHPMQSERGRQDYEARLQSKLGVPYPFCDPGIQRKAYQSNLANHGGRHSQRCPEVLEKARKTWLEKYGVDNPSKVEEVKARIKEVWMGKYGVPFPPQSLWANREQRFPNYTEMAFQVLCPTNVVYAGDGSYWVRAPGETRSRNPDFVVLTAEQVEAWRDGASLNDLRTFAVVEVFGDYWHGPKRTGVDRDTHKRAVVDYYKRAGLTCLVLWETEIKQHPMRVAKRLRAFLDGCGR